MTTAADMLAAYLAAESALLQGKEATFGDRRLRYEDLAEIRKGRQEWERRVSSESARAMGGRGLDFSLADLSGGGQ